LSEHRWVNLNERYRDWCGLYKSDKQNNPIGALNGNLKVYRGGSFLDFEYGCTVSVRGKRKPHLKQIAIGFRIVKSIILSISSNFFLIPYAEIKQNIIY